MWIVQHFPVRSIAPPLRLADARLHSQSQTLVYPLPQLFLVDEPRAFVEPDAGDAVHFTGRIPHGDVAQYYSQLDVFVIPRINERAARLVTPLKPYEAMALGIPLVVSDLPALQEITGAGARGETFVTGDASSLADVLEGLAASPGRRADLSEKARAWVLGNRTWADNDDRYARIYETVLGAD